MAYIDGEFRVHQAEIKALKEIVGEGNWIDGTDEIRAEPYITAARGAKGSTPLVVLPKNSEEVKQLVDYANAHGLHFVINAGKKSGRTGLVEAGIPKGEIVIATERMNKIHSVTVTFNDGKEQTVRFDNTKINEAREPAEEWRKQLEAAGIDREKVAGVRLDLEAAVSIATVNTVIGSLQFEMPIGVGDPSATVCACIANGAAGDTFVKSNDGKGFIQTSADLAREVEGVYGNGEHVIEKVTPQPEPGPDQLRLNSGVFTRKELARSQGVLGLITRAVVEARYIPKPEQHQAAMVAVSNYEEASTLLAKAEAWLQEKGHDLYKFEFISGEMLELVKRLKGDRVTELSGNVVLFHATTKGSREKFEEEFLEFITRITDRSGQAYYSESGHSRVHYDGDYRKATEARHSCTEASDHWLAETCSRNRNDWPKYRFSPDISLPPSEFDAFATEARAVLKDMNVKVVDFGHFRRGGDHFHVVSSDGKPINKDEVAKRIFKVLRTHRGSPSAEHGVGTSTLIIDALNEIFAPELDRMEGIVRDANPNLVFNRRSFGMDKRILPSPGKVANGASHEGGKDVAARHP